MKILLSLTSLLLVLGACSSAEEGETIPNDTQAVDRDESQIDKNEPSDSPVLDTRSQPRPTLYGEDWSLEILVAEQSNRCSNNDNEGVEVSVILVSEDRRFTFPRGVNMEWGGHAFEGEIIGDKPSIKANISTPFLLCFEVPRILNLGNDDAAYLIYEEGGRAILDIREMEYAVEGTIPSTVPPTTLAPTTTLGRGDYDPPEETSFIANDWIIEFVVAEVRDECEIIESDGIAVDVVLTRYDGSDRFPPGINLSAGNENFSGRILIPEPTIYDGISAEFTLCFNPSYEFIEEDMYLTWSREEILLSVDNLENFQDNTPISTTSTKPKATTTIPDKPTTTVQPNTEPDEQQSAPIAQSRQTRYNNLLAGLPTAPECSQPAYDRSAWGGWRSWPGQISNVRHGILLQQSLVPATVSDGKVVLGEWVSLYDSVRTTDPSGFDIDHIVPVSEAHESGGCIWSKDKRRDFYNDVEALLAVTASSNRSKGAQEPQTWLPDRKYKCWYLIYWMEIKKAWGMSIDSAEKTFLSANQTQCAQDDLPEWPELLSTRG